VELAVRYVLAKTERKTNQAVFQYGATSFKFSGQAHAARIPSDA
jgi:hypothetical protein